MPQPKPLREYVEALGGLVTGTEGDLSLPIHGASSDSRSVQPGWLFMAIPGARRDGADFVPQALAAGAVAVVAARPLARPPGVGFVQVGEPYRAAGRVAELAAGFPARALRLVGVTGTNGKTTTAYLMRDILRRALVPQKEPGETYE